MNSKKKIIIIIISIIIITGITSIIVLATQPKKTTQDNRPYMIENGEKVYYDLYEEMYMIDYENMKQDGKECIADRETALAVGTAILKGKFPQYFKDHPSTQIDVGESNGLWEVFTVYEIPKPTTLPNGSTEVITGGEGPHVIFRKSTGEVITLSLR